MGAAPRLLGERLVARGDASPAQVDLALREQVRTGALLGEILVGMGVVAPRALALALAEQGGVPFLDAAEALPEPAALARVPEPQARRLRLLPLAVEGWELRVAMANIFDVEAVEEVERATGLALRVACAEEDALAGAIAQAYGDRRSLEEIIEEAIRSAEAGNGREDEASPLVTLVDHLLQQALRDRATDLHIQPGARTVLTRYRVDGRLVPGPTLPKALQPQVLARLKILAEVDIAEARRPQDGKFRLRQGRRAYDVRASFLPAIHGEKAVLRILDKTDRVRGLDSLGMPEDLQAAFAALLDRPHGMILVTGPTGSGKTTTLYAALARLDTPGRCLVTVEDPVEYDLPMAAQVPVNPRTGLTFAEGLRSILRQDPDVILVGEIRDPETAAMAIRAGMTGHLVLSSLHTHDALGAVPRLRDLGISPLDLATTLLGVHAQRLVRLVCTACAEADRPEPALLAAAGGDGAWRRGRGCPACAGTGVKGRRAIHDLVVATPSLRALIAAGAAPQALEAQARRDGRGGLRASALRLAREGAITLEEALAATAEEA